MTVWLPTVDGPKDLPDLRQWLLDHFKPGTALYDVFGESPWISRTLRTAALWWVEPDTCAVLADAAPTIPADTTLNLHDLPTPSGLAIFASDLEGTDADATWDVLAGKVRVSGIMWGPITLGGFADGQIREALSIGTFSRSIFREAAQLDHDDLVRIYPTIASILDGPVDPTEYRAVLQGDSLREDYNARFPKDGDLFSYLGRSDWLPDTGPDTPLPDDDVTERALASKAEDRRLVAGAVGAESGHRRHRVDARHPAADRPPRRTQRTRPDRPCPVAGRRPQRPRRRRRRLRPRVEALVDRVAALQVASPRPRRTERKLILVEAYRKGDPEPAAARRGAGVAGPPTQAALGTVPVMPDVVGAPVLQRVGAERDRF